jgi:hypothetical protein
MLKQPLYPHIPQTGKRQCKNPYREFAYCELCKSYIEWGAGNRLMTRKQFLDLANSLGKTTNPMYMPDSRVLYLEGIR